MLQAPYFIDATELGDLLPLTKTEFVTGGEGRAATGEPHTPDNAAAANQQAFTAVLRDGLRPGLGSHHREAAAVRPLARLRSAADAAVDRAVARARQQPSHHPRAAAVAFDPVGDQKSDLFNLWRYRRIANRFNFVADAYAGDLSTVNWPQNDYLLGNLVGVSDEARRRHVDGAKQLSLSLLYWLQTEAPRPDGKAGWRELRLRSDVVGTEDGLAKYPYIREARRIKAVTTVLEQHCGTDARAAATGSPAGSVAAFDYPDSVGIGSYRIDLHPTSTATTTSTWRRCRSRSRWARCCRCGWRTCCPACKNLGTTHITNGCYRLHPVEWNIGEAAGALAAFAHAQRVRPHAVRDTPALLADYQKRLDRSGRRVAVAGLDRLRHRDPGAFPPAAHQAGVEDGDAGPAILNRCPGPQRAAWARSTIASRASR